MAAILDSTAESLDKIRMAWERDALVVVTLCAAWCRTCDEFRIALARIAASRPDATFVWLDVEDDEAICGDVDVENFPTLAVFRGNSVLHFGITLPHEGVVTRLVDELALRADAPTGIPETIVAMRDTLRGP
jgi:thioredoxin 1